MEKKARLSSPMLPHLRLRFLRIVSLGYRETSRSLRIGASFWLILSCLYFKRHFYLCLYRFLLMQLTFYIYIYIYCRFRGFTTCLEVYVLPKGRALRGNLYDFPFDTAFVNSIE